MPSRAAASADGTPSSEAREAKTSVVDDTLRSVVAARW
jgi:hypothetical protein